MPNRILTRVPQARAQFFVALKMQSINLAKKARVYEQLISLLFFLREGLRHLFELFLQGSICADKKASGKSPTDFYFFYQFIHNTTCLQKNKRRARPTRNVLY
jgi:hypothetical protein